MQRKGWGARRGGVGAVVMSAMVGAVMASVTPAVAKDRDTQPGLRPQAVESAKAAQFAQAGTSADYDIPAQDLSGAVTAFGVLNDTGHRVNLVLDAGLMQNAIINCHPLVNTMTTSIARDDLLRFFAETGHTPRIEAIAAPPLPA